MSVQTCTTCKWFKQMISGPHAGACYKRGNLLRWLKEARVDNPNDCKDWKVR